MISKEMRLLEKKWKNSANGSDWPKRIDWLEIDGLRGWSKQRIEFSFPIIALIGENGSGKSTILQSAACAYKENSKEKTRFPSEFFPETAWDKVMGVNIEYGYKEGKEHKRGSIRKPTSRWLGLVERPLRSIEYIDLSRIQPVNARVGYAKIAKTSHKESSAKLFDPSQTKRFSFVMGKEYDSAKMALSNIDKNREIPVVTKSSIPYSGFHQGSGETTIAELLRADLPKYGLILIDEIESSLHPRAQRRLIRDLAEKCREREMQIVITTHSPYILEELPLEARLYIHDNGKNRQIIKGVSPEFAMTKMDDDIHPECDLYVEDIAAKILLEEIIARHGQDILNRCSIVPFGAAGVGKSLGMMIHQNRFTRPTCVFLDGDMDISDGCHLLPGGDAPERVVFSDLKNKNWGELWTIIQRDIAMVGDELKYAMTEKNHHEWPMIAANKLNCTKDTLWKAMCAEWVKTLPEIEVSKILNPIRASLP